MAIKSGVAKYIVVYSCNEVLRGSENKWITTPLNQH